MKSVHLMGKCIGNSGLNGLDRMLGYAIANEMKMVKEAISKEMTDENKKFIKSALSQMKVLTSFNEAYEKTYTALKK
jgi:hypothetical protein